ncbi:integrator complex subunit 1-like [Oppia nitens]|uniref:integrator complex subunit 1-like n=1 Tax=Oppia nitens TaxID=1686743 RepID=UPI0023DA35A7|nr:integrator complex subunit 1-like [Oppia nitens]
MIHTNKWIRKYFIIDGQTDRHNRMASKRGPKVKMLAMPTTNFIALGTTSSTAPSTQLGASSMKTAPKREPTESTGAGSSLPKKSKLQMSHHMTRSSGSVGVRRESGDQWEEVAKEVDPNQLLDKVIDAEDVSDERVEALLCGAVRQLRVMRLKPDSALYLTLCYLAKTRPLLFCTEVVVEAFCSLLKRDSVVGFKQKVANNSVAVLATNILLAVYHDENCWPETFLKVFVDDSLGDRFWVDNEECKGFVDNILASFSTRLPPKSLLQQEVLTTTKATEPSNATSSPIHAILGDETSIDETVGFETSGETKDNLDNISVMSRFAHNETFVVQYVTDIINEGLNRRPTPGSEVPRNLLKLLISTAGIPAVRLIIAQKIESWLISTKTIRISMDLMLTLCLNCNENDTEVVTQLVKMRLKTKPLITHFINCIKEMINQKEETFKLVLRTIFYNEISPSRSLNNIQVISVIFQTSPIKATKVLAEVYQELIYSKDDYLKTMRGLLREIVRALRHEHLNLLTFAQNLIEDCPAFATLDPSDSVIKERAVVTITDLFTMIMFLSLSPAVKEAFSTSKPDRKEIIRNYQMQIANIQRIAIYWLQKTVIKLFRPDRNEYLHCLNKVLFMESAEHYYNRDNWPPENDRNLMFRMTSEVPLLEETLIRVLTMGAAKDNPLSSSEAIELSDALIKRAATITDYDLITTPVLQICDKQIFTLLMTNAIYRHPENITLPQNYDPPKMAISDLYWKAWIQLLILTAHNPSEFGTLAWDSYPTLGVLIEMSITNHFEFPPPTKIGDDLINRELQMSAIEKQQILQFEQYLAAASTKVQINESNSLLLSKLISMDPLGSARKPPSSVLEQFKQFNTLLRLGHLLCQSRNPDFLLEIIQRQQKQSGVHSTSAPMPWLVELVESNDNNFGMLPVQCLCEFLLGQISEEESMPPILTTDSSIKHEKSRRKEKRRKQLKLISHLQTIIASQSTSSKELIEYFMKRLTFQQSTSRTLASKALSLVLTTNIESEDKPIDDKPLMFTDVNVWLNQKLPSNPNFAFIKTSACDALRPAILVETVPSYVCYYIQFLSLYGDIGSIELAIDCSNILIDRQLITNCIIQDKQLRNIFLDSLTKIFLAHLVVKRRPAREAYSWTDAQDHILVQWPNEEAAILHISVVHAMIILLTFGPSDSDQSPYKQLFNTWFCEPMPQAFLVDTSEEALLIPDWLRIKLLKSSSPQLRTIALKDIESSQLILFIQSSGLSISSMECLLGALDSAVDIDSNGVKEAVMDESLILRVVEVQWLRGVKTGHKFADLLGYNNNEKDIITDNKIDKKDAKVVETKIDPKFSGFKSDFKHFLTEDKQNIGKYIMKLSRELTQELFDKKITTKKFTKLFFTEFKSQINACIDLINRGDFNSLFNTIITFAINDSKHLGLKTEIMSTLKILKECTEIKNIAFLNVFNRFTTTSKTIQETKTSKTSKKEKKNHTKSIEELAKILLKDNNSLDVSKGLLLEKFHKLEPELVCCDSPNGHLETQLLFSQNCLYLMSLLIHKTRFETLNSCIKSILSDDQSLCDLNATAVLDFLTACLGSPRLWIGRDLRQPKHMEYEDVLKLNDNQIKKLIKYIIEESNVAKRVLLVVKSCCFNSNQIQLVVNTLKQIEDKASDERLIASELLFRLYLQIPSIEQPIKLFDNYLKINGLESSAIDSMTHNLLTAFTSIDTNPNRQQSGYLNDCELSMLKLASKHPILFLRQLPMIPALLRGKSSVTYDVFRSRNYLLTFKKILNILRLLKPHLWNKHVKGLNELLSLYIQLFVDFHRNPGKELLPLISQFLYLIDDWIKFDSESAKSWIKLNRKSIVDLSIAFPEQMLFKSLLSGLPFQSQSLIEKQISENILIRLRESKGNVERMNQVLNDLDKLSDSKPDVLEYFVDDLRQLYFDAFTREMAFKLTLKLLNFDPNLAKTFVATYCQCLQRNDSYLTNLALDYLPEFVILAQEHRSMILKKAFEIGIMGNNNVINNICDSFALINAQIGV